MKEVISFLKIKNYQNNGTNRNLFILNVYCKEWDFQPIWIHRK